MKSVEEFMKSKNINISKISNIDNQKNKKEKFHQQEKNNSLEELDLAKTKVLKYITYKKRTENEVRTKFRGQIQEEMLENIIEYLRQADYLNDSEFIEKQVNEYMNLKTMSIKEIKYKLYAKGLDKKLIEKYIEKNREKLEEYEQKCIEKIKIKKAGKLEEQEIKQFLFKKGYNLWNYNIKGGKLVKTNK